MASDENDILQAALESGFDQEAYYVEKWRKWITIRELPGNERGDLMEKCLETKGNKSKLNQKRYYAMLAILSTRCPDPDSPPSKDHPHYKEFPGLRDDVGNYITQPHPKAGELVFKLAHMGPLNEKSGAALEYIGQVASRLSALRKEDVDEKKGSSESDEENEDFTTE